ncbi:hypothetical protein QW060_18305 [Myroides ceti]|uniref:Uncharacterized protein n=1 Tax=Paenimyroides ceti TaxID=395087 RepID=A0ABT8CYC3_9FLAO|nr:hypothetical protein [Paenimyroides ceti]MDN3707756.1 hypothetical protein [Paenimyroides ceti]MDN3708261.1 hypothetical protein [Paenimyroides ceti]MDN3709021.1 hypothetical protein [Paenimyroides ceti]
MCCFWFVWFILYNNILCGHVYIIRGKKIKAALLWIFKLKNGWLQIYLLNFWISKSGFKLFLFEKSWV